MLRRTEESVRRTISSDTSPWIVMSSSPCGFLVTLAPVANFWAKSLAAFLRSMPNDSRLRTVVTYLRLLRSMRLIVICWHEKEYLQSELWTSGSKGRRADLGGLRGERDATDAQRSAL